MFPPPENDDDFFNHQQDHHHIPQNLFSGQASLDEIQHNQNQKKILRKDIEKQRRLHMSTLNASLRSLLPLDAIKGKRSVSDQLDVAEKYITHLKKNIEDLSEKRDRLKSNEGNITSSSSYSVCVHSSCGGVEIVISGGVREEKSFHLSRVLEVVVEQGLDVVRCVSTQTDEGIFHTIQAEVGDSRYVDLNGLQEKLNCVIASSRYDHL